MCRPTTLQGLFDLKAMYNDAKLVVGNTEVGIEMKFKSMAYPHLVGVTHIAELNRIEVKFSYLPLIRHSCSGSNLMSSQ